MLEEVDRLTRLVDSLLVLSRADAGDLALRPEPLAVFAAVREAVSMVEVLAEEKAQRVEVEGEPSILASGDRVLLRQALINLLHNAIKYSPVGALVIARVASRATGEATVEIVDRGPGIPAEHRERVFERLHRVDPARSRDHGGAGLGLAIARWAVHAQGGSIRVGKQGGAWKHLPRHPPRGKTRKSSRQRLLDRMAGRQPGPT